MIQAGMTRLDAAREWVHGFNAVPTDMIAKLMAAEIDDWCEVTRPTVGDWAYASDVGEGEIVSVDYETGWCKIDLGEGKVARYHENRIEVNREDGLPMWSTMWSFDDNCDEYWLEEKDGLAAMSKCGFRIFKSEEFGYFFGIDGAGYDFYEAHWLPLYEARGLKWHDPQTDNDEVDA